MSHISAGVRILSELQSNDEQGLSHGSLTVSSRPFIELAQLEVLFNRLDSQVVHMMNSRPMTLGRICRENAIGFCAEIPPCFTTLEEARNSFDYHWNGCLQLFTEVDLHERGNLSKLKFCQSDRQRHLDVLECWGSSFQAFLHKYGGALDRKSWQGVRVIQIVHIFASTMVEACSQLSHAEETVWDKFLPRYKLVLGLAEEVVDSLKREANASSRLIPNFSLDMSFVAPLYAIAHRCRHPVMRRQAVALLYAASRQEGIWDSFLAARVAEKLISIEEEGLGPVTSCEDVPDAARLNAVDVQFHLCGRVGTIKYSRTASPHASKRQDFVETIEW